VVDHRADYVVRIVPERRREVAAHEQAGEPVDK
jgi:hypothetical protein